MKLTESQRQHLFDLLIACDRPRPDSDALVKKGLAQRGRGHFGEWVRISAKGIELAKSWPDGERIAREARWINARTATKDSTRTVDRGGRATSSVVLRADAAPTEQQSMSAAATKSKRPPLRSSISAADSLTAPEGRRRRASARGDDAAGVVSTTTPVTKIVAACPDDSDCNTGVVPKTTSAARVGIAQVPSPAGRSAAEVVPNAVRVTRANKVTYYPLSMFGSIKDATKQRCRTANRHYRSYALAASESDQVVL